MRPMRRLILLAAVIGLLVVGSSSGASRAPAFKATLTTAGHTPKVLKTWKYSVRVTDPAGHPIAARITSQIVDPLGTAHLVEFDGTGRNPYVKDYRFFGNFCDSVLWPKSSAVGVTLRFQVVIVTAVGRKVLSYPVTPRS
jgi:hypothetical protein